MLHSKHPDHLQFRQYLDKQGDRRRAPQWTISWNETGDAGVRMSRTASAADHLGPGQYKADRDIVTDVAREVPRGCLSKSKTAPRFSFGFEDRLDENGALKGITRPGNRLMNTTAPGSYAAIDGTEKPARVRWPSTPAFSVPRGEAQEAVRARRCASQTPGPGMYDISSPFDTIRKKHEAALAQKKRRRPKCEWDAEFSNMFRSLRPSAMKPPGY